MRIVKNIVANVVFLLSFMSMIAVASAQSVRVPQVYYIKLLDTLVAKDQYWRGMMRKYDNQETDGTLSREVITKKLVETDSLNYFAVKNIIRKIGYPNYDKVGKGGSHNFWLLVQHQDAHPEFQDSVLTMMQGEVERGKVSLADYAFLVDRVRVNAGKLQFYGTQMEIDTVNNTYRPKPVEDMSGLDERRRSMGLPTLTEYIRMMNEMYHGTLKP